MSKKILVVGGGGREHAIIKALKKSPDCGEIWCAPGNGGIRYDAKCKNIKATDVETMVGFAVEEKFDYVVVAQDDPLALGMVDELAKAGIPGRGFADFVYLPKPEYRTSYPALLVELKWNKSTDTAMEQIKQSALRTGCYLCSRTMQN